MMLNAPTKNLANENRFGAADGNSVVEQQFPSTTIFRFFARPIFDKTMATISDR